ncbi:MAG: glycosyltransferase family 2 protein [Gammaproteobacteria bacterium]
MTSEVQSIMSSTTPVKAASHSRALLSVVVPAYNEAAVLPAFYRRLTSILDSLDVDAEIVFIDDGSGDETLGVLQGFRLTDGRIAIVSLSRNFGKEIALTAGLDHARGDAVVVIDADLQDPPELIPQLVEEWRNGYDVVYAKRSVREGETLLKKITAHAFYRLMQGVGRVKIPQDTGDFRLLSRRAVDALAQLKERNRFMKGLFTWIGYRQRAVAYRRDPRLAGKTKWNYWRLWNFAIDGITSFTTAPLKMATYIGISVSAVALLYAGFMVARTLVFGNPVEGYTSLLVIMLFLGGVQLFFIGIIGEYLGRMFDETKNRPLYLVNVHEPSAVQRAEASPRKMLKAL